MCSKLPYVRWMYTKNNKTEMRFQKWDRMIEERRLEQLHQNEYEFDDLDEDEDDYYNYYYDEYDYNDEDDDLMDSDIDEYDELIMNGINENGLGLGNAILDDIFRHMF